MKTAFQYRPKFVDIRVRPPKPEEAAQAEDVYALKPGERPCDHAECRLAATARAPKSRDLMGEHYWFCQTHAAEYNRTYTLNINPHLASVTGKVSSASPLPLPREGMTPGGNVLGPVPAGATITVRADWTAESRESYPVWETATQSGGTGSGGKLVTHFEALRVSWFGTGGAFAHDRSGRGETETETFTEVEWKAPDAPGQVFVWAVLRDSRGGVDWGAFRIEIQ